MKKVKDLIIIGAGGFGREVLSYALEIQEMGLSDWKVKGFLNDIEDALEGFDVGYPILGPIKGHVPLENAVYICAIGDSEARLRIGREFLSKGAVFTNIINPYVKLRERNSIGVGNIICPGCGTSPDVKIGNFVLINASVGIGHDSIIEDGVTIGPKSEITGNCKIEECVYIGAGAIITPKRRIGAGAKICAGSVIFTHVKPGKTMLGNPAMVLK